MKRILIVLLFMSLGTSAFAVSADEVSYEKVFDRYSSLIDQPEKFNHMLQNEFSFYMMGDKELTMAKRYSAMMDALWDKAYMTSNEEEAEAARLVLEGMDLTNLDDNTMLRGLLLAQHLDVSRLDMDVHQRLREALDSSDERFGSNVLVYRKELVDMGLRSIVERAKGLYSEQWQNIKDSKSFVSVSQKQIQDLVFSAPDLEDFAGGRYEKGIRLYMFCRSNRKYPCMMIMKDHNNQLVYDENGELWHQQKLGLSRRGIPSSRTNGHTPTGVHTIDSVMPKANRKLVYGKYRRLILNFIPRSQNEVKLKSVLPASSRKSNWWKQSVVARDVGRTALRIHGTGLWNNNEDSSFWPFVATSGCVTSREGSYDKTYIDQRHLLDQMMISMGLPARYSNETKLRGLLHVIEIDQKNRAVTLEDIKNLL